MVDVLVHECIVELWVSMYEFYKKIIQKPFRVWSQEIVIL